MGADNVYQSHNKKHAKGGRTSRANASKRQGRGGLIRKYGLNMSRQEFRQYATDIGFVKYR